MVIQCSFSHKVWESAYNYTENQACYIKLISPIYLTIFFLYRYSNIFTVTKPSLPFNVLSLPLYLSHTGEDKKRFLLKIMSLKVLIYNMLLEYCTLMLGIVFYMHT